MFVPINAESGSPRSSLPIILIAAAIQGVALYLLHLSVNNKHWPATDPGWLLALYAVTLFAPLTAQLMAEHVRDRRLWLIGMVLTAGFLYFGWHHGTWVLDRLQPSSWDDEVFPVVALLGLLWLLIVPFVQCYLLGGRGWPNYQTLFTVAWRNKLTLAEAALFTGLFWLLLGLWAQLFGMLKIELFTKLFSKPLFIYPVTALVFGFALYLIGSLTRLVTVVLEQGLSVLKWLAVIAGLILALFSLTLATKMPGLIATGARAISAGWLLWLIAVMLLLVNAAYRDGTVAAPYPRWIGITLRCVMPLLTIIFCSAGYAIYLRVDAHGVTVGRFWACVVAAIAGIYALGYAYTAVRQRQWMAGIDRINVVAAWFMIAVIVLALTPVLSPYRIAAASQLKRALRGRDAASELNQRLQTPLEYLRFDAGRYGRERLQRLSKLENHSRATEIRAEATKLLARTNRWERGATPLQSIEERLARLTLYPNARSLQPDLRALLLSDLAAQPGSEISASSDPMSGLFVDLDGDGVEELVLLAGDNGLLYARRSDQSWFKVADMHVRGCCANDSVIEAVKAGEVKVLAPRWRELEVAGFRFHVNGADNR